MRHLWECDHDYYCNLGNYFSNDCGDEFESWADFIEEYDDCDFDMNLVFRFDWLDGEGEDENGVPIGTSQLRVFWMGQRKGLYRFSIVTVTHDDEPAVRKWLTPRFEHLKQLWEPLNAE